MLTKTIFFFALLGAALSCLDNSVPKIGVFDEYLTMAESPEGSGLSCARCGQSEAEQPHLEASTLEEAALYGDPEQVLRFIGRGADVSAVDASRDDLTPLHLAVESANQPSVKALIDAGANPSAQNRRGVAPLHTASANGHFAIAKLLIDAGADVNVRNQDGGTPLHATALNWQPKIAKLLVDAGADVHARDGAGRSPLHEAAGRESLGVAQVLLDAGADVNAADDAGRTVLQVALDDGPSSIPFLLDRGARVSADDKLDDEGNTMLHRAAQSSAELLEALLAAGGLDIEARNKDGETPLLYAAAHGSIRQLRLLMDAGADAQARTEDGETALHMAAGTPEASWAGMSRDAVEKIALLIEAGVDVNARTTGHTALDRARKCRFEKVAGALRERGATE
ncbi:Ankyrin repeat-containing domain protein [Cordyceps fumosorosea ARSEF 2679]|uniref:Ankyrin repeat-containing domain protein n=1 Tax=Cordyceps fumosorosea (strain ARSEF 2679) TaxID=1081104 RepID=A0A168CHM1_CORFA|nr:Ankyrin repeat-containing domain protein [Cordyceps fumosorosea ARSEF 2679]OAA71386.1 Ankyrin repeat-containing domain protein [Cordyceps fumosorosea ARSEF 2679]